LFDLFSEEEFLLVQSLLLLPHVLHSNDILVYASGSRSRARGRLREEVESYAWDVLK
jgi:hypothetical protein